MPVPDPAAEAAAAAARAAELARERAAQAAEDQAEQARAAQTARISWEKRGRPNRLVLVRRTSVDSVSAGSLVQHLRRPPGALTLSALNAYLPESWLLISDGTASLSATLVLSQGVALDVGGDIRTVKLVGGATAAQASSIFTGGGQLTVRGATITSADPRSQEAMPATEGRPVIAVGRGGRFNATDVTISDLGTPGTDIDRGLPGLRYNPGSSGALVRTTFLRNSTGLRLSGTQSARLEDVTVADSAGDGLVLEGDQGSTVKGVRAERNGGSGVLVTGPARDSAVGGITTEGNGAFGVTMIGQSKQLISGVVTANDKAGGLRVGRSTEITVTAFRATDQPMGVFTNLGSTQITLDGIQITGGRRGVVVEKSTEHVTVIGSTIEGSKVAGIAIGGREVELRDVTVRDAHAGVRVERGAAGVRATGLTLTGGEDGFVASAGASRIVMQNLVADGVRNDAVRTFSPNTEISGGKISGGATGIDTGVATTISDTEITLSNQGIRVRATEPVMAERVSVAAVAVGVNVEPGSPVTLTDSRVYALESVRGDMKNDVKLLGANDFSLPPLNVLGAIGVPLILLAYALEQVHTFRQRRAGAAVRRRRPPRVASTGSSAVVEKPTEPPTVPLARRTAPTTAAPQRRPGLPVISPYPSRLAPPRARVAQQAPLIPRPRRPATVSATTRQNGAPTNQLRRNGQPGAHAPPEDQQARQPLPNGQLPRQRSAVLPSPNAQRPRPRLQTTRRGR